MTTTQIFGAQGEPPFSIYWQAGYEAASGNGVQSTNALEVTDGTGSLEIDIATGTAIYQGTTASNGSVTTKALSGGGSDDRWDLVVFDVAAGSVTVRQGTAAANPTPPDPQTDEVILAIVYVAANATSVGTTDILNCRVVAQSAAAIQTYPLTASDLASGSVGIDELASPIIADVSRSVGNGNFRAVAVTNLADTATLSVSRAELALSDGQPAPTDCDLVIATLDGSGGGTSQTTLISGDGSTVFDNETGSPLGSYTNGSGSAQSVAIAIDNGGFNAGSGSAQDVVAGAVGEVN